MGTRAARWTIALATALLVAVPATAQEMQTIRPGMSTDEVKAVLGAPAATRDYGDYTFYFYQNGVEREYGTADIVFFLDEQVVDAVLRSSWREYAGESSSPRGTEPRPTPGGMHLQVPGEVQAVEVRTMPPPPAVQEQPAVEEPAVEEPAVEEQQAPPEPQPEPVAERVNEIPAETPPPLPPPVLPAEFEAFIPVCIQSFEDSGMMLRHEGRPLCQCTASESAALGVETAVIVRITEALKDDPSALSLDERVRQAGSTCVDRMMDAGRADADTTGTGG